MDPNATLRRILEVTGEILHGPIRVEMTRQMTSQRPWLAIDNQ